MCNCISEVQSGLKDKGVEISSRCIQFSLFSKNISSFLVLPLVKEGTNQKPKSSDPQWIRLNFCPFCGEKTE